MTLRVDEDINGTGHPNLPLSLDIAFWGQGLVLEIHRQQVFLWGGGKKENAELIIINQWLPNSRDKVGNLTRKRSVLMDSHRVCCPETYPRGFWA